MAGTYATIIIMVGGNLTKRIFLLTLVTRKFNEITLGIWSRTIPIIGFHLGWIWLVYNDPFIYFQCLGNNNNIYDIATLIPMGGIVFFLYMFLFYIVHDYRKYRSKKAFLKFLLTRISFLFFISIGIISFVIIIWLNCRLI